MSEIENTRNIERLLDVEMGVTVRFGATKVPLRDVVNFGNGSMIELNRMVDEPVELLVNNFPFARGEVVVIDGYYSVKITEIESAERRSNKFFPDTPKIEITDFESKSNESPQTLENQEEVKTKPEEVEREFEETEETVQQNEPKIEKED